MRTRARWLSLVAAGGVTIGAVTMGLTGHGDPPRETASVSRSRPASPPASPSAVRARALLRAWDRRRAAAWAQADTGALGRLYVPGSATGRRDVAMLTAYRERGLRVTGMTRQVVRLRVAAATPRRVAVVVTDRLVDARVVGAGVRSAVPEGHLTTRRVSLAPWRTGWRVAEVAVVADHPAR